GGHVSVRLTVRNNGNEPALTRLQCVDKDGKVLAWKDTSIQAASDAKLNCISNSDAGYSSEGTLPISVLIGLQAQFGTNNKSLIGSLRPTLEIIDRESGKTVKIIGPERFKEFKPDFHPPL